MYVCHLQLMAFVAAVDQSKMLTSVVYREKLAGHGMDP